MDSFTSRERAAFTAGIETARQMALTAAVTIEVRDAAAAAALQGLAEGLRALAVGPGETGAPPPSLNAQARALTAEL